MKVRKNPDVQDRLDKLSFSGTTRRVLIGSGRISVDWRFVYSLRSVLVVLVEGLGVD